MIAERRWSVYPKLYACCLLLVLAFFGCGGSKIAVKPAEMRGFIDDARDSVILAKEAGAYEYAPDQIARAESLLARAEEAAKDKKRGAEAMKLASDAKAKAEVANAVSRQAKDHQEEIQEKDREIAELEYAQKEAEEAGNQKAREAQALREKVEQIEMDREIELSAARAALMSAEEKANRIQNEKDRELAAATSEYESAKEKLEEALKEVQAYSEKITYIEQEKAREVASAKAALRATEDDARKAEEKARVYSGKIAALEREREKEIATYLAKEDIIQKKRAETESKKEILQGKPNIEALEEVGKALEGLRIAWQIKDVDKYMSYYADQAEITKTILAQGKESQRTLRKSDMREEIKNIFSGDKQFSMSEPEIEAGSDAVRATFKLFKSIPESAYEERKAVLKHDMWIRVLLFRETSGKWRIVTEDWNLYQDVPEYAERR